MVAVPDGCGDEVRYIHDGGFMTENEVMEYYAEPGQTICDVIEQNSDISQYSVVIEDYIPENHNVFFTETACLCHMEQNRHHFSAPSSYVMHAFRNPELEKMFEAIRGVIDGKT